MRRRRLASPSYRAAILATPGLVGYWRLGELSGTVARDELAKNHGTYVGSPTLGAAGLLAGDGDKAVTLNGSSQYVSIAAADALNLTAAFSVSTWIYWTSALKGGIVEKTIGGVVNTQWSLYIETGSFCAQVTLSGPTYVTVCTTATGDLAHALTMTYDGATLRLFLNGVTVGTPAAASGVSGGSGVTLLGDLAVGGYKFGGRLDEINIWNRALTAAEIAALYRIGKGY